MSKYLHFLLNCEIKNITIMLSIHTKGQVHSIVSSLNLLILTGFYIYIEASSPRQENDRAVIAFPPLNINGPLCLSFYYHMYGYNMGTLAVLGRWSGNVREIWNKTGN